MSAGSALQREIRQRVPFSSPQEEAILAIARTADVLRRRISRLIEPYGVTEQQYNVLRILRGAGCDGLPTLDIAERMIEQTPGITRMIDRLETKGLVSRERGCQDRRQVLCRISQSGLDLLAKLDEPLRQWGATALGTLREKEMDALILTLARIRAVRD
jgi:MarR family transcriptional regulator, organic hydroperoxide resistance regulator